MENIDKDNSVSEDVLEQIIEKTKIFSSYGCLERLDLNKEGIKRLLIFLEEKNQSVSAGEISEQLNVSTARVAVLLRKMQDKGYITKTTDPKDGRKACVSITKKGRDTVLLMKKELADKVTFVVNRVGEQKVMEFLDIADEIKEAVREMGCEKNINSDV